MFALVSAWSSQRVLFHWAAPGYLMLFPLLGDAVARRLDRPAVRRLLVGTAVFVVLAVAVVATQVRFDWLHPALAAVTRTDPDVDAIDWTSLRDELAARDLLPPGTIVGVPNWRDAGKVAYALGPDVTTLCLNRDARQFGIAEPPTRFLGADVLILAPEHGDRVPAELGGVFDAIERLPDASVTHAGRDVAARCGVSRQAAARLAAVWLTVQELLMVRTMTTVSDRVLSPTELRALSGRSNAAGAARLGVHVGAADRHRLAGRDLRAVDAAAGDGRASGWCRWRCSRRHMRRRIRPPSRRAGRT